MIRLEAGKSYRDASGKIWGPIKSWGGIFSDEKRMHLWNIDGKPDSHNTPALIEEANARE